jgi:hypothetical protein
MMVPTPADSIEHSPDAETSGSPGVITSVSAPVSSSIGLAPAAQATWTITRPADSDGDLDASRPDLRGVPAEGAQERDPLLRSTGGVVPGRDGGRPALAVGRGGLGYATTCRS